jgi:anti-sigma factor RsiW
MQKEMIMRCPEVQQKLDLFIRQELTRHVRERIESHLGGCERCREELARLRRLEDLLASGPCPPVPEGFAERVVETARREAVPHSAVVSTRRHIRKRLVRRVRIAAGTVAALAGGILLGGYLGSQTWGSAPQASVEQADPVAGSGLGQLIEPGGDSLAQTYLALTADDNG